jgi:NADH dehydrogenase FAD-containing subunit
VVVDDFLRPFGGDGSVFWIGDAAATSERNSEQLPPTAQVARSQGEYVADLFNSGSVEFVGEESRVSVKNETATFSYSSKGAMAYVGRGAAAIDFPKGISVTGQAAGLLWQAYETVSQMTAANKLAVAGDFARTALKGRKIREESEGAGGSA